LCDIEVVNQESRNFEFNIKPLTERCDKFQGCQTYDDWIFSTSAVPCGFLSPSGYDAFMESKAFKHCKIVVYTVIHGGYDVLKSVSEREEKVCYIAFVDSLSLKLIEENKSGSGWDVQLISPLPYPSDLPKSSRVPKLLAWRLFPDAMYSIYIDGKISLKVSPMKLVELLGLNGELAIFHHAYRISTFTEFGAEIFGQAHDCEKIVRMWRSYRKRELLHSTGMIDSCLIIRRHQNVTHGADLLSCHWHNDVAEFSHREQLSFFPVADRLNLRSYVVLIDGNAQRWKMTEKSGHLSKTVSKTRCLNFPSVRRKSPSTILKQSDHEDIIAAYYKGKGKKPVSFSCI